MTPPHVSDEDAAGIASLAPEDPERVAAFEHARVCPGCDAKLREGLRLMDALAELPLPVAPSPEALARASEAIRADLAGSLVTAAPWLAPLAVGAAWVAFSAPWRHGGDARAWAHSLALGATAVGLAAVVRVMRSVTAAAAVLAASGFALLVVERGAPDTGIHLACSGLELAAGMLPLGATVYGALRFGLRAEPHAYAAVSAAGSLAGMAAMHVGCPDRSLGHLSVFHVGSVLVAALLGAAVGRLPALRARAV